MHFTCSLFGGVALLSLISAVPVELDKKAIGYGDRGEYLADYMGVSTVPGNSPTPTNNFAGSPLPANSGPGGGASQSGVTPTNGAPSPVNSGPGVIGSGGPNSQPSAPTGVFPDNSAGGNGEVTYPLPNGFPDVQNPSEQLNAINRAAQGSLSNAPPPAKPPGPDTLTSLQLIAFNELFEVFFFTELLNNITNSVPGYEFQDFTLKKTVIDALTAAQAQEQLHALNTNNALRRANVEPIKPCKYNSPVSDFKSAIALAATFTDVVLGTLADASVVAGSTGDPNLIRGFSASLGQEGEQNGFYRSLLGKIPSALPFLTASTRQFAFSALNQNFIVPGSCPNADTIKLPIFGKMQLLTDSPEPRDQSLQFRVEPFQGQQGDFGRLSVVYINQQLVPIVLPIESISSTEPGGPVQISAIFPYEQFLMNGLTIAVLAEGAGPFANVSAVAAATKFGPALIEIN